MSRTIVIIGGVAGGASAAARLRRLNETDHIILVERGKYISFANCGLPYYIGGVIQERDKLLVQTIAGMKARFNIDIRVETEALSIDRQNKTLTLIDLPSQQHSELHYDILILSPGAKPFVPAIPGLSVSNNVFTLRSMPDTDNIKNYVDQHQPKHITIIGAGFIGIEMAENLKKPDNHITVIEAAPQILAPLDVEMAAIVDSHMQQQGIEIIKNDSVTKFDSASQTLTLNSGQTLPTDMIILSIGVTPDTHLAKEAGLELGLRDTIVVNDQLKTSDPAIYAVGDAIQVVDLINQHPTFIPLAWPANRQGRLVADIINGRDAHYDGTLGTAIAKVFELTAAATGNNEKVLRRHGISYQVVHTHACAHANYYPDAHVMALKLLYHPDSGEILGAQAVGMTGVDKRIDVLATAIKARLTIEDLPDLELAYAPPYSSAKDPVNMLGYVASNIFNGDIKTLQWHEVEAFKQKGGLIIDVSETDEYAKGYLPDSINHPLSTLRVAMHALPKHKPLLITCRVGLRGYLAARILMQHGWDDVTNLDGGYKTYSALCPVLSSL